MTYNVFGGTLNLAQSIYLSISVLSGVISMRLGIDISHVSGHCSSKGFKFRGQRSRL